MPSSTVSVFVVCTILLYAKFIAVTAVQSRRAFESGSRPPEDNSLRAARGRPTQNYYGLVVDEKDTNLATARAADKRWRRIVANDVECIPFALVVFAAGVLADANKVVFVHSMVVFTIARFVFSYVYAKQLQPHRSIAWFGSQLCVAVAALNALVALAV